VWGNSTARDRIVKRFWSALFSDNEPLTRHSRIAEGLNVNLIRFSPNLDLTPEMCAISNFAIIGLCRRGNLWARWKGLHRGFLYA
jgi:hypothetical protein